MRGILIVIRQLRTACLQPLKMRTHETYAPIRIALHWLIALLMVAVYVTINLHEAFPKGTEMRTTMKVAHYVLGFAVAGFTLLRLAAAMSLPGPVPLDGPKMQQLLAKAVHLGLFALMLLMPILGYLALSFSGKPVSLFGLDLPLLTWADKGISRQIKEVHEAIGTLGYALIGLHALGALYHHHILKDSTLLRMWR